MKSVQYNNLASILGGGSSELVRDQFNTRKMIVAVTGKGKVSSHLSQCCFGAPFPCNRLFSLHH